MKRSEYYLKLERWLKRTCRLPLCIERFDGTEWVCIREGEMEEDDQYRVWWKLGGEEMIVEEQIFDDGKYDDVGLACESVREYMIKQFERTFL